MSSGLPPKAGHVLAPKEGSVLRARKREMWRSARSVNLPGPQIHRWPTELFLELARN
jgi:hypothetical protein